MSETVVRRARLGDVERMYEISVSAHRNGYEALIPRSRYGRFRSRYTVGPTTWGAFYRLMRIRIPHVAWVCLVAETDGRVVGYHYSRIQNERLAVMRGLFVDPAYQGRGVGSRLFERMIEALGGRRIELTVIEKNAGAIRLYEKYGFVIRRRSYRRYFGARQIIMVQSVKTPATIDNNR